jgi:hypothetical protein
VLYLVESSFEVSNRLRILGDLLLMLNLPVHVDVPGNEPA